MRATDAERADGGKGAGTSGDHVLRLRQGARTAGWLDTIEARPGRSRFSADITKGGPTDLQTTPRPSRRPQMGAAGPGTGGTALGPRVPKTLARGAKSGGAEAVFGCGCCCICRWCVAHSSRGQGVAGSNPASPTDAESPRMTGPAEELVDTARRCRKPVFAVDLGVAALPSPALGDATVVGVLSRRTGRACVRDLRPGS